MTTNTNTQEATDMDKRRIIVQKYTDGGIKMCDTTIMIEPIERKGLVVDRIVHVSKGKTQAYWYMTAAGQCVHASKVEFDDAIASIK